MADRAVTENKKKIQGISNQVKLDMKINSSALITVFSVRELESLSNVFEAQDNIIKYP